RVLLELLEYEYLIDIKIKKLPLCFLENCFDHFDNSPSKDKVKSLKCFNCRFNSYCNGFFPEMEDYVKEVPDLPKEVIIEVTDKCNLKCNYCFNRFEYKIKERGTRKELSSEEIKELLSKIKEFGVGYVRFSGGEPLLRQDLFELMTYAKKLGLRVWLNTNGTLVNKQNSKKICEIVENVLIPLNGFDRESEMAVTNVDSFEAKLKAIGLLQGVGVVRCGIVLTKSNVENMERFYTLAQNLKITHLEFYRPIKRGKEDLPTLQKAVLVIDRLNKKYKKNYKIANAIPFCFSDPKVIRRVAIGGIYDDGASRMVIDTNGRAKPNYYWRWNFGSCFEKPLWGIWHSKRFQELRNLVYLPKECNTCSMVFVCRGGSRALAILNGNGLQGRDPLMREPIT
ncbi:radical SAM protein, partial [Candidatus Woesearchaeota archaeon]|nr:radical SAM protein [Candidatus Woesearchaeota archaeon]